MANTAAQIQVILASTETGWGGGEAYLSALARGLRDCNVDVRFLVRGGGKLEERVRDDGFAVEVLHGKHSNPFELWRTRRWLQSTGPAILQCNDSRSLTRVGLAAKGLKSIRVLSMRHTMFPIRSATKYRRLSDRVVCVSNAVADKCLECGLPPNWLQVIHSAIDYPQVSRNDIGKVRREFLCSSDDKLIVAVGNLFACKGHSTLVEAASYLRSKGIQATAVIAGEGSERESLEAQIAKLGLQKHVHLLGFRNDANALLAAADVVAHPAHDEGLCLTVACAMMLKRPIVATSVGGLADVLGIDSRMNANGPFAEVIAPGDPEGVAVAIQQQLQTPTAPSLLTQAHDFAKSHFTTESMVEATLDLYNGLQGRKLRAA